MVGEPLRLMLRSLEEWVTDDKQVFSCNNLSESFSRCYNEQPQRV